MKINSFLRTALIAVLCLSMLFCVACTGNEGGDTTVNETPAPTGNGDSGSASVPTEDGKVTYYFTMSDASVEIPEWDGIFITGGAWGWATGSSSEMFTKLEGTNIYYLITDKSPATEGATEGQEYDFQLVVGLTQASGAASWGLQWNDNYKSAECAEVAYPDNPQFTWTEGSNTVNLGTHTFGAAPAKPVEVNTTLAVKFTEALPEGSIVLLIGDMDGWNGMAMTSTDGKVWTVDVKLLANSYGYKVCVYAADSGLAEDFSNKWDDALGRVEFGKVVTNDDGTTKVENASVTIMQVDEGGTITLLKDQVYTKA